MGETWRGARRVLRDPRNGYIAGVCAGIARAADVAPVVIRLGFVVALFMFGPLAVIAYLIAAFALPVAALPVAAEPVAAAPGGADDVHFSDQPTAAAPASDVAGMDELAGRYRAMEQRVAAMEAYVTSREFTLNRAIRDLER